ncbi:helix-turn-helix transcriptional regulator (plasmid) [Halobacillus litoralis]|uniref:helix-turn-helix transcriptional regulator n=1 Tax=Halobacillus litoralis TaxID=45668 RepID=UPI001CFF1136|nr:helix-turn-helix transcriptional regulator [Halobacillus litoralis]WLR49603.1 helix-turn-helix transcriptional regulator [Halobacillus litoralis]
MIKPNTELMRQRREMFDLSQQEVAFRLQALGYPISDNHYSRIERGSNGYNNIQLETAFAIAKVLKYTVDDLFIFQPENEVDSFSPSPEYKERMANHMTKEKKLKVGQAIRDFRKKNKLSAKDIAEKTGMATSYVYHIEKGYGSKKAVQQIIDAFNIKIKV